MDGVMIAHITPGPDVRTPTGAFQERWCFKCRSHTCHERTILSDSRPSYYEPISALICGRCDEEHIHFPGCGPL